MQREKREFNWIAMFVALVLLLVVIIVGLFITWEKIENGYVGVRYSMNGGIKDETLSPGVKFVGLDKVTQYPIRLQTIQAKNVSVSTSDGKKTTVNIKYDYKIDPTKASKMYKEFGNITSKDIEEGWLKSKLQKEARSVYSQFSLLEVLGGDSSKVGAALLEKYTAAVESKGFLIEDVTVAPPAVDDETQKSIDGIIQAGQDNQRVELEAVTAKTKADTKAYEVEKQAESQAAANKKLSESITPELIGLKEAEARLIHGWITTQTGQAIVDAK